jgi:DNA repair protein RecO
MREQKTLAILLKKTGLANDDAILEFLTFELGRISVFAKKFAKSKKRNEIDFFRVIEIGIFQGRSSKSLKTATTFSLFHNFSRDFASTQIGFSWLEILRKILPVEEINSDLFKQIIGLFSNFSDKEKDHWDAFFKIKMLNIAGFWPKLDTIRSDIYFDPYSKLVSRENFPESIFISNTERQVIEFLRRSDLEVFLDKHKKLPQNIDKVFEIISLVESFK